MKLYGYYRSSASYRVRIALALKGLDYEAVAVNLLAGEQRQADYQALNPQGLIPLLETDAGELISQSTAILEWLEEAFPAPALYPGERLLRARTRSLVNQIACDIHPLNNLRVLRYLEHNLGQGEEMRGQWYRHWVNQGLQALEPQLQGVGFCVGDAVTMADIYLVPQVYNALRFDVDMTAYPRIQGIYARCCALAPFQAAAPQAQADVP